MNDIISPPIDVQKAWDKTRGRNTRNVEFQNQTCRYKSDSNKPSFMQLTGSRHAAVDNI